MEGLTKQQLILLALLVSFVTSIATGIVTVALMDQAPKEVVQTINRVVERTVEKVVPSSDNAAAVVMKETVVVKADDMVVSAVEKNKQYILRVMKVRDDSGTKKETFGGLAVPISKDGLLVTDISVLNKELDPMGVVIPESYRAIAADSKSFSVVPVGVDDANSLVFFKQQAVDGGQNTSIDLTPISLGNSDKLKLGQTIIVIGGDDAGVISTGIVSALMENSDKTSSKGNYLLIKTDVQFTDSVPGAILLDLSGDLIGMVAGKTAGKSAILPSYQIYLTPELAQTLESSSKVAAALKDEFVSTEHLFISMLDVPGAAKEILSRFKIDKESVLRVLEELKGSNITDVSTPKKFRFLSKYTRNLTALAKDNKLDPVIGRDIEISRIIQILSRRTKNNPILIGEAGVGKTAIVEG